MESPETGKTITPPPAQAQYGGCRREADGGKNETGAKRSRLVTITAVLTLLIGGFLSVSFARANFTLISIFSSPAFQLSMAHATVPVEMPPAAVFLVQHTRGFFFFALIMWLSVTALGFGVLRRAKWGRGGFTALLYLGAAGLCLLFLFPELIVPKPLFYHGVSPAPEFNAAVKAARLWLQVFCGLGAALGLWLAKKFESEEIKKEFNPGRTTVNGKQG